MKHLLSAVAWLMIATMTWAAGINYDGATLELNNDFTRTECGTSKKKVMKEVSGMAASRQTTGYLWAHGDENTNEDKKIIAIKPDGTLAMTVMISGDPGRDDWEDIATGIYDGKNYIFIGAFGDNNKKFKDEYYIYYLEEPEITSGTQTANVKYIRFGYPDDNAHNTETLMYDNMEQMFYIVDKVEGGACTLYRLPFKTNYGTGVQKLTEVCKLGNGNTFDLVCGGDITPDGRWMAIKNYGYILLWERQGSESLSETAKRRPQQIAAYQEEKQGEALAWTDATTFYTTSDATKDVPIYQYVRKADYSLANITSITINGKALADYNSGQSSYDVELAYGTTTLPTVAASASDEGQIIVVQATELPGNATVICTSHDGKNQVIYTIRFSVSATQSSDATLKSLTVNGSIIDGFSADKYEYIMEIAYLAAVPVVTAEAHDEHATVVVNNLTEVSKTPSNVTVVVTAQDKETSLTYTIAFHRADAIKQINEVVMSNHYNAFINEGETVIRAYYLAGEQEPTIASYKVSEGATLVQNGKAVILTGADGTTAGYTLDIQPVEPVGYTDKEIVFDGTETWVKSPYGWDSTKKWKFSKTDTDYSREIAGKTHVDIFLPACDTVVVKSMDSKERDARFYINGEALGDKTLLKISGNTFVVKQSAAFMLTIVSAQSSGDGGVKAIRMARANTPTSIRNVAATPTNAVKIMWNGQIIIIRNKRAYNTLGIPMK
ncbi:MAG: cadherin-like beta sandwich domain-containing protein [Paludibacteraceae bacterium]|nr:cadherin-like beta sandwich domain-containing protein [Paludibacteraceae bacterium]